jgi:preprotein translocase subunit SecA
MDENCQEGMHPEYWNVESLRKRFNTIFGIDWNEGDNEIRDHSREELRQRLLDEANACLNARIEQIGEETFYEVSRMYLLRFTDTLWKNHLLAMDRLRQGVSVRSYGQRNPLLEYKREAYHMYLLMDAMRDEKLLEKLCLADEEIFATAATAPSKQMARQLVDGGLEKLISGGPDANAPKRMAIPTSAPKPSAPAAPKVPVKGEESRLFAAKHGVRRNDPCPCGSGAKFKKCCYAGAGNKSGKSPSA